MRTSPPFAASNLVDLVEKDDSELLDPEPGLTGPLLGIDELVALLLGEAAFQQHCMLPGTQDIKRARHLTGCTRELQREAHRVVA